MSKQAHNRPRRQSNQSSYPTQRSPYTRKSKQPINIDEEGMWVCVKCGNQNYASRTRCNMRKCGAARPDDTSGSTSTPTSALQQAQSGDDEATTTQASTTGSLTPQDTTGASTGDNPDQDASQI